MDNGCTISSDRNSSIVIPREFIYIQYNLVGAFRAIFLR